MCMWCCIFANKFSMAIAAANAWHHDFQYAVVQYFAERNTSACLCVVNCCLRLKLAITFYLYVILPVRILSVDFGVYSMSRVEVRLERLETISCRNEIFYAVYENQLLPNILFFQPICSTLCLCALFFLILGVHGTEFVDVNLCLAKHLCNLWTIGNSSVRSSFQTNEQPETF